MKLPRRRFLHLAAGAAALPFTPYVARAQAYPTRPVTIIVPFAAGGATDISARIIGEYMSRMLGQPFVVENVTGAGGTTGSTRAKRSRPDGQTILMAHTGTHAFSVPLYPNLAYKPDVDFAPIGLVYETPYFIVARKDFAPKDLKEFTAYVKANNEKLNVSHAGVGSLTFGYSLLLNSLLGVKPTMVPFGGALPAANALIAGQVDYMCNGFTEIGQQVQAGILKAYAIGAPERHLLLPDVPTAGEAGLPEFEAVSWFAMFAPKDVPQPVLDQLSDLLDKALDDDNVRKRLSDVGADIPGKPKRGQQPLATLLKTEIARWTPILKAANIRGE